MKKTNLKRLIAIFAAICVLLCSVTTGISVSANEAVKTAADETPIGTPINSLEAVTANSVLLNGAYNLSLVSGTASVTAFSDRTVFGEGDGYTVSFSAAKSYVDIDIKHADSYKGVAAYAIEVNNVGGEAMYIVPQIYNKNGPWEIQFASFFNADGRYHRITNSGAVTTPDSWDVGLGKNAFYIPADFAGYIVLPVKATNTYTDFNNIGTLRLTSTAARTVKINNTFALFDISDLTGNSADLTRLGVRPSTCLTYRPVVEIPFEATTANIKWNAVENATSYKVDVYTRTLGVRYSGSYSYNTTLSCDTATADLNALVPDTDYAIQIRAFDGNTLLSVSELKEFTAEKRGNITLINDMNNPNCVSVKSTQNSALIHEKIEQIEDYSVFPDGVGFKFTDIYRDTRIGFELENEVDLSQFDGFSFYGSVGGDGDRNLLSLRDWQDDNGNLITRLPAGSITNGLTEYRLANALTNWLQYYYTSTDGVYGNGDSAVIHHIPYSAEPYSNTNNLSNSYGVLPLVKTNSKRNTDEIVMNTALWGSFATSNYRNNHDDPFYIDSLMVIDNLDLLAEQRISGVSNTYITFENATLLPATSGVAPTYTANVTTEGINVSLKWDEIRHSDGSLAFKTHINVYVNDNGHLVFYTSKMVDTSNKVFQTELTLPLGYDYTIQVACREYRDAVYRGAHLPITVNSSDYSPAILGATFNQDNYMKFVARAPSKLHTGSTVKGYGIVMLPVSKLSGELTVNTKKAIKANIDATPALSGDYSGILQTKNLNINADIAARAYITYADANGKEYVVYSDETIIKSIADISYDMAEAILTYPSAKDRIVKWTTAIKNTTTADAVRSIDAKDVRAFVMANTASVSNAYIRNTANSESRVDDTSDYAYVYHGRDYVYAITDDYKEVISYVDESGEYVDAIAGAGGYNILGDKAGVSSVVYKNAGVAKLEQTIGTDGATSLKVTYFTTGIETSGAEMSTTYTFRENHIDAALYVKYSNPDYTLISNRESYEITRSMINREFLNEPKAINRRWSPKWVFNENGDFPYRATDAWVQEYIYDDDLYFYTYFRGDAAPDTIRAGNLYVSYSKYNLQTYFEEGSSVDYTAECDLVFTKTAKGDTVAREKSLFAGLDSDFSARIWATDNTNTSSVSTSVVGNNASDNTAVFTGDKATIDITVTGIKTGKAAVTTNYQIYDYYGKTIASATETASLAKGASVTYSASVQNTASKHGMYFILLTVSSDDYTYREYYSFALVEDHAFSVEAMQDLPFGISQTISEDHVNFEDQWAIHNKLGIAKNRSAFMARNVKDNTDLNLGAASSYTLDSYRNPDLSRNLLYLEKLKQAGMSTTMLFDADPDVTDNKLTEATAFAKYASYFYNSNEDNHKATVNNIELLDAFNNYYNDYYLSQVEFKNAYNEHFATEIANGNLNPMKIITSGISYSDIDWIDMLNGGSGSTHGNIYNTFDALSIHTYSTSIPQLHLGYVDNLTGGDWNIGATAERIKYILKTYGDKFIFVDETGSTAGSNNLHENSLRMQADFDTQAYLILLNSGADWVASYCMYDYCGFIMGADNNYTTVDGANKYHERYIEWNYGRFYYPDFYGRILPKPSAAAYANMTRILEGYSSISECISGSGGVTINTSYDSYGAPDAKAYKITVKDYDTGSYSNVYVAWSVKGLTYTTANITRNPQMPWKTDYITSGKDTIKIKTSKSSVKVYDTMGNYTTVNASGGYVTIPLTNEPSYIVGA